MSDWVVSNIAEGEEVSSIISNNPAPTGNNPVPDKNQQVDKSEQVQPEKISVQSPIYHSQDSINSQPLEPQKSEEDKPITHLGNSYKISDVTIKNNKQSIPSWLLALVVLIPVVIIFIMGAIANREERRPEESFLFKTLESKYFTLNFSPDYEITSIVDKKVPFIEKHDLVSNIDGEKSIRILVKDIKFDYSLDNNAGVKARRENSDLYTEEDYELGYKQGLYFKKKSENFDHFIILLDRGKSVLYEMSIQSASSFADDEEMQAEVSEMLESLTFL